MNLELFNINFMKPVNHAKNIAIKPACIIPLVSSNEKKKL